MVPATATSKHCQLPHRRVRQAKNNVCDYVLTKPYTWGGSVWTLEKSNVQVETSITEVKAENGNVKGIFDLAGRLIENPTTGIYIVNGKKLFIK